MGGLHFIVSEMYSGPLSQRIAFGLPRHSMICSNDRITRALGNDKSTSIAKHSRLKSSMTLKVRMLRPLAKLSDIKSIDQTSLIVVGTLSASGLSRLMRFLGLIRKFSSSSQ